jgi:hypothetical protein
MTSKTDRSVPGRYSVEYQIIRVKDGKRKKMGSIVTNYLDKLDDSLEAKIWYANVAERTSNFYDNGNLELENAFNQVYVRVTEDLDVLRWAIEAAAVDVPPHKPYVPVPVKRNT